MESAGKRRRVAGEAPSAPEFVNLRCMDDSDTQQLQHVRVSMLKQFNCRLYREIMHDKPRICDKTSTPYYEVMMTRAMLQTLVRAMVHGTLSLSEGVCYNEAVDTFNYEGITYNAPPAGEWNVAAVRAAPNGVGWKKRADAVNADLQMICDQLANAMANWPRLEHCMDSALQGHPTKIAVTGTRAWVRFVAKPEVVMDRQDPILSLVRRWPAWLSRSMQAIGSVHYRLTKEGEIDGKTRDMNTFGELSRAISADLQGKFFTTRVDIPRSAAVREDIRRQATRGERFATEMRNTILEQAGASAQTPGQANLHAAVAANAAAAQQHAAHAAASNAGSQTAAASLSAGSSGQTTLQQMGIQSVQSSKEDHNRFARACVCAAEQLLHDTPNLGTLFSGRCLDANDKSTERSLLAKAMLQRGIRICRWDNPSQQTNTPQANFNPLLFPASWVDPTERNATPGSVWASVLLDFSGK